MRVDIYTGFKVGFSRGPLHGCLYPTSQFAIDIPLVTRREKYEDNDVYVFEELEEEGTEM